MSDWKIPEVTKYTPTQSTSVIAGEGVVYSTENVKPARIAVSIGGATVQYAMISEAGGSQPMRTQFDVAMDGKTIYTLSAGKGIGSYNMTLMDGPFICGGPADRSILDKYPSGDLEGRKIVIVHSIYNTGQESKATFKGIINSLSTVVSETQGGQVIVATNVKATGMWEGK